jgi:hypothetical protein
MKNFLPIIFFALFFGSCRQDVVAPNNPAGNINEPQLTRTNFSYSFTINADRITRVVTDNTNLITVKSRFYAVISDYSSGTVEIIVKTRDNDILYSVTFDENTSGTLKEIEGYQPNIITINFVNFTGKFRVTLTDRE